MTDIVTAPWTVEQVQHLNWGQRRGYAHPFTCGDCRDNLGIYYLIDNGVTLRRATDEEWDRATGSARVALLESDEPIEALSDLLGMKKNWVILDRELVATIDGWICPTCDYTQNWCHQAMLP